MSHILMFAVWIGTLFLITLAQCWQIHTMKSELRKCLKIISRQKRNSDHEKAISQISKSLDHFEEI